MYQCCHLFTVSQRSCPFLPLPRLDFLLRVFSFYRACFAPMVLSPPCHTSLAKKKKKKIHKDKNPTFLFTLCLHVGRWHFLEKRHNGTCQSTSELEWYFAGSLAKHRFLMKLSTLGAHFSCFCFSCHQYLLFSHFLRKWKQMRRDKDNFFPTVKSSTLLVSRPHTLPLQSFLYNARTVPAPKANLSTLDPSLWPY